MNSYGREEIQEVVITIENGVPVRRVKITRRDLTEEEARQIMEDNRKAADEMDEVFKSQESVLETIGRMFNDFGRKMSAMFEKLGKRR